MFKNKLTLNAFLLKIITSLGGFGKKKGCPKKTNQ